MFSLLKNKAKRLTIAADTYAVLRILLEVGDELLKTFRPTFITTEAIFREEQQPKLIFSHRMKT